MRRADPYNAAMRISFAVSIATLVASCTGQPDSLPLGETQAPAAAAPAKRWKTLEGADIMADPQRFVDEMRRGRIISLTDLGYMIAPTAEIVGLADELCIYLAPAENDDLGAVAGGLQRFLDRVRDRHSLDGPARLAGGNG